MAASALSFLLVIGGTLWRKIINFPSIFSTLIRHRFEPENIIVLGLVKFWIVAKKNHAFLNNKFSPK